MDTEGLCLGIDLGTTFSTVSYYDMNTKRGELVKDDLEDVNVPSWISFSEYEKKGVILVGKAARQDKLNGDLVIFDAKRLIGREYVDIKESDLEKWPFTVRNIEGPCIFFNNPKTEKEDTLYPEEVSGIILKYLIDAAKRRSGKSKISKIIVTVPAEFKDKQRNDTLFACHLGFKGIDIHKHDIQLLNEPSAAILEYKRFLMQEGAQPLKNNAKVVVIDFGGGTLDINCCACREDTVVVEANGGDQNLGGNDFDDAMLELMKEKILEDGTIEESFFAEPKRAKATAAMRKQHQKKKIALRKEAERIKILLSRTNNASVRIKDIMGNAYDEDEHGEIEVSISRSAFENKCEKKGLFRKFETALKKVTGLKGYRKTNIDVVLLVGGACLMPKIRDIVAKLLGEEHVADTAKFDPLTAVSKGAALYGFNNLSQVATEEFHDTIPYPIGLEVNGGRFDRFCEACEQLPLTIRRVYSLQYSGQKKVDFNVFRGEHEYVNTPGMEALGSFQISDIPAVPDVTLSMAVTMNINNDGRVNIDAECDDLPPEYAVEQVEEDEEHPENVVDQKVRRLEGNMKLELDFSKKTAKQLDIIEHFETLNTTGAQ